MRNVTPGAAAALVVALLVGLIVAVHWIIHQDGAPTTQPGRHPTTTLSPVRPGDGGSTPGAAGPSSHRGQEVSDDDPAAATVWAVLATSRAFTVGFLSYGYPDNSIGSFVERSRPYMSSAMYEQWRTQVARADSGSASRDWDQMITRHQRRVVTVGDIEIGYLDADQAVAKFNFQAAVLTADSNGRSSAIPAGATVQSAALQLRHIDGHWKVVDYSPVDLDPTS